MCSHVVTGLLHQIDKRTMSDNVLCGLVKRSLLPTYRVLKLGVPLILWSNMSGCHFRFNIVDLPSAVLAFQRKDPVDVFVVDSLKWDGFDKEEAIKLFIYAAIQFYLKGVDWIKSTIESDKTSLKDDLKQICSTIVQDLKSFTIRGSHFSMRQRNSFDCGIFTMLQMHRLSQHLNLFRQQGEALSIPLLQRCLQAKGQKRSQQQLEPIDQDYVTKFREMEFLFLLSLWVTHFNKLTLNGLNKLLESDESFSSNIQVPYIGVDIAGKHVTITSVRYKEMVVLTECTEIKWKDVKFLSTPTYTEIFQLPIKASKLTETINEGPTTCDLARMFPGHPAAEDKYMSADYIVYKSYATDTIGKRAQMPGFAIHSSSITNADSFLTQSSRKRKLPPVIEVD